MEGNIHRYEAPEGSESAVWVEIRWSTKRKLFTAWRSNAVDDGEEWFQFLRPIKNHVVAKRQTFEANTWLTMPLASVHMAEEMAT
jgi:hypothetical protein